MSILRIADVSKHFGGVSALSHVTLTVSPGEVYGLIGPNGAGTTTLLNLLNGIHPVPSGPLPAAHPDATTPRPPVLLLDEPAAGCNEEESRELSADIRRIRDLGITVVLIEHDMSVVMDVCGRIAVLNFGERIAEGSPAEIQNNPAVVEAYLGR